MESQSTHIPGASLRADIDQHSAAQIVSLKFWVGVLPSSPVESIDCAGVNFPKVSELLVPPADGSRYMRRIPKVGAVTILTEKHITELMERLPRLVIRFREQPSQMQEPGTGQNLGDPVVRGRRGFLITIPREEDLELARSKGRAVRPYVRQKWDEPAADYMYARVCTDQNTGNFFDEVPKPLSETGLEWPANIASVLSDIL